jgi:hypothetical protein
MFLMQVLDEGGHLHALVVLSLMKFPKYSLNRRLDRLLIKPELW